MTVMYLRQHLCEDGTTSGVECVNPMPRIPVTPEFLEESKFLTRDGDTFTLHCVNGTWTYRILPHRPWASSRYLLAVLIEEGPA